MIDTTKKFQRSAIIHAWAATGSINGEEFSLICPDKETCEKLWAKMGMPELDMDGLQAVVLLSAKHLTDKSI